MIDRTFLKYKFFRTHIGGSSKKHEVEIFKKVQVGNLLFRPINI